jgi:hypothetical protein
MRPLPHINEALVANCTQFRMLDRVSNSENTKLRFSVVVVNNLLTVLKFWWGNKYRAFVNKNELLVRMGNGARPDRMNGIIVNTYLAIW